MKHELSKSRLEEIANFESDLVNKPFIYEDARRMARALLAAYEQEPVAWRWNWSDDEAGYWRYSEEEKKSQGSVTAQPLYTHPAPSIPAIQPVMFIDGNISPEDADKLAQVMREFNEEDERPLAKMARTIRENPHPTNECDMPKVAPSIPAAVPEGYCMMPLKLSAENGAKGALSGEFHVTHRIVCQSCGGEGCEDCNEEGGWDGEILIGWDIIKQIHEASVEACALPAAPKGV